MEVDRAEVEAWISGISLVGGVWIGGGKGRGNTPRVRTKTACLPVAIMAPVIVRPRPPVPPAIATRDMMGRVVMGIVENEGG